MGGDREGYGRGEILDGDGWGGREACLPAVTVPSLVNLCNWLYRMECKHLCCSLTNGVNDVKVCVCMSEYKEKEGCICIV